jgi:hypothetical protein
VGLLIDFGDDLLKNGIHRIANNYIEETTPSPGTASIV